MRVATRVWGRRSDRLGSASGDPDRAWPGYTVGTLIFTSLLWLGFEMVLARRVAMGRR
jgi:hypothetical protein